MKTTTTTRTAGVKKTTTTKSEVIKTSPTEEKKEEIVTPETNGEVKIMQEEMCIEDASKVQEVNGGVLEEELISTTQEVVVNGDGAF